MKELTISEINKLNYAQAPTWKQIEELVNEMNMTYVQFERFYGIPYNQLTQIKAGTKNLPAYAWHFVYEKIKPAYGIGFVKDYNENILKKYQNKSLPKKLPVYNKDLESHERMNNVV